MEPRHHLHTLAVTTAAAIVVALAASFMGWQSIAPAAIAIGTPTAPPTTGTAPSPRKDAPIYSHGDQSKAFFDEAYAAAAATHPEAATSRSAISAHHMLVAQSIAELFLRIGDGSGRTVVILSPNHFDVGRAAAQVSIGSWTTPYGTVSADREAIDRILKAAPVLKEEEAAFPREHGIGVITPFVARSFPGSRIVPILLRDSLSPADRRDIARAIATTLPDATVIASIDMSHYLPSTAADFHDALTLRRIEAGGCDGCTTGVEIDANAVLDVLLAVNTARGDQAWHLTHHGNSLKMLSSDDWEKNTSHILGYFTTGMPTPQPHAALTFVGDIMLGRSVHDSIVAHGVDYPWSAVDRFLSGTHLVVGNLEGTVGDRPDTHTDLPPFAFTFTPEAVAAAAKHIGAVSLANNHIRDYGRSGETGTQTNLDTLGLRWFGSFSSPAPTYEATVNGVLITIIGYHAFAPDEKTLLASISAAHAAGRTVIVMPHWGVEYQTMPSEAQRALAHRMVAAGADLIIGGHPHVVQNVEDVDGVPVIYSLGNFIFDQPMPETRDALTVGVIIEPGRITLSFMPVLANKDGRPVPMADSAAHAMLADIAARSSDAWKTDIASGTLSVIRAQR